MTRMGLALLMCLTAAWAAGPPDERSWTRFGQIEQARVLEARGWKLHNAGQREEAEQLFREVLKTRERLYPEGHSELADSIDTMGYLARERADFAGAEAFYRRGLRMNEALYPRERYPQGHPLLAQSLNNLALVYEMQGAHEVAEPLDRRALAMREALFSRERYPQGHAELAQSLNNLALLLQKKGDDGEAERLHARALAMREALYPPERYPEGHRELATSLNNLAALYKTRGDYARAEALYGRALRMHEKLYPAERFAQGHPDLARSLNNLGSLLEEVGEYARAEEYFLQALRMRQALYPTSRFPRGHPALASSLTNLGTLHKRLGDHAAAETLLLRVLQMTEKLYPSSHYPRGHPALAGCLNNLIALYSARGEYDRAEPMGVRLLAMMERLYPRSQFPLGHPNLLAALGTLGSLYTRAGKDSRAEPFYLRSLAMAEALYPAARYPEGHPDLAWSLHLLTGHHLSKGDLAAARPFGARALHMCVASATAVAEFAPEATALNYLESLPLTRDAYLSITRGHSPAEDYGVLWQSKAALSRIYERRHLNVLSSTSKEARQQWDALITLKRQREALLLTAVGMVTPEARDRQLKDLDEKIRDREVALRSHLPALPRYDERAKATPEALRQALPPGGIFVDFLQYARFEQNPRVPGKGRMKWTPCLVAFLITRERITRVELGDVRPIEELVGRWRKAIKQTRATEPVLAGEVHQRVWAPLAKHLPDPLKVVFVAPDLGLTGLPWAALRDPKRGRILIENHPVAVISHGPMLLASLTQDRLREKKPPMHLAMGPVAYDERLGSEASHEVRGPVGGALHWPALPGTGKEIVQIIALASGRQVLSREGKNASVRGLLEDLPRVETAHLATHGFFADKAFRSVLQLDEELFGIQKAEAGMILRVGAGIRSPMVLSGLVCAGANVPGTPGRGVLTAAAVANLDLRRLNLAVLSACETGLGDVAGGEGVYGLTRAFHIAGTRNVIASLWKVDDEATAALMVLFYKNLWGGEGMTPMEALRKAQLALYREPDRVKEWAGGRGVGKPVRLEGPTKGKTSPVRAWAAFMLSGPGD